MYSDTYYAMLLYVHVMCVVYSMYMYCMVMLSMLLACIVCHSSVAICCIVRLWGSVCVLGCIILYCIVYEYMVVYVFASHTMSLNVVVLECMWIVR